ncbi:hypothetical protein FRC14_005859 [Serendipita sp. 396]|nr:hypothetical protein FRC14_005859 [Serendipita sp. 396]
MVSDHPAIVSAPTSYALLIIHCARRLLGAPTYAQQSQPHPRWFTLSITMADKNDVVFNAEHEPKDKAIEAFQVVEAQIKKEIIASRHHWDDHDVP